MNHEKIERFENQERLEELRPMETLKRVGFKEGMVLCDIGAGTGIFSIPAAEISSRDIYALEKSDDMIDILKARKEERKIKNLKIKKVESHILPIEDKTCDFLILITVLHHIDDKKAMVSEIKRILKDKSRITIVEFHKKETKMGPPVETRISKAELEEFAKENNLKIIEKFDLGDNLYTYVFQV